MSTAAASTARRPAPGGSCGPSVAGTKRPRWEVHERHGGHAGGWRCHAAFERRRDALVFPDTPAAATEGESVTTAPPRPRGLPEPSQEPPSPTATRRRKGPTTHELDDTRSQDHPLIAVRRAPVRSEGERRQDGEPVTCLKRQLVRWIPAAGGRPGCCPRQRSGRGTSARSSTGSRRIRAGTPSWPARRTRWRPGKRPRSGMPRSWRWSRSHAGGRKCRGLRPTGWRSFDELIADALNNPAPVQKAEQ